MSRPIVFVLAICIAAGSNLSAQNQTGAPSGLKQLGGYYASVLYHSTSDFPVTMTASPYSGEPSTFRSDASCAGLALGCCLSLFQSHKGYAGLELAFSRATFSDLNVTKKPFYFIDLFLHFGLSPLADGRTAIYGIFGGGLVYHSESGDDFSGISPASSLEFPTTPWGPAPEYYLEKYVGAMMWGVGARINIISNIVLSAEYKWMYNTTTQADFNRPVTGMPDWYYTHDKFDPIGSRVSIGISYIIGNFE